MRMHWLASVVSAKTYLCVCVSHWNNNNNNRIGSIIMWCWTLGVTRFENVTWYINRNIIIRNHFVCCFLHRNFCLFFGPKHFSIFFIFIPKNQIEKFDTIEKKKTLCWLKFVENALWKMLMGWKYFFLYDENWYCDFLYKLWRQKEKIKFIT